MAAAEHFAEVLLVGHVGKLVKLAGGIMNTHSHTADCRTELFCTHAALCGADREVCTALYNAATTDACLEILDTAGLREPVLQSLLAAIQLYLDRRAGGAFRVGRRAVFKPAWPAGTDRNCRPPVRRMEGVMHMVHFVGAGPGAPDLITQRGAAFYRPQTALFTQAVWSIRALLGLAKRDVLSITAPR